MAGLILKDIQKSFGKTKVLHGISMDINDGEFIVIVGPSGCGKSTLLRMIAGLENVTSGEILINKEKVNDKEPMDRNIAMVFQNYALYPHMSVFKNMAYGLKIAGLPKVDIKERVREAAKMLELGELLERKPRELSGGQRQRVAIARALVNSPSIILADEPTGNLDSKSGNEIMGILDELHAQGNTIILVTHEDEIAKHAKRTIRLFDGKITEDIKDK